MPSGTGTGEVGTGEASELLAKKEEVIQGLLEEKGWYRVSVQELEDEVRALL